MKFKVFNIEFDGIDKVGKDTVMKQIFSMAPNKYIPKARGIMSQIAYAALNNRNYEYEINKGYLDNTLIVYLTVDEDDWKVRCDLSNEKAVNATKCDTRNELEMVNMKYSNHVKVFDYAYNKLKDLGMEESHLMTFNTSHMTAFQIIKEVLARLDELNK